MNNYPWTDVSPVSMNNYPWTDVNPFIDITPTRKKFFNKFCYALVYKCLGGRVISLAKNKDEIDMYIDRRVSNDQNLLRHAMWTRTHYLGPDDVDRQQIKAFFDIKHNRSVDMCVRVEEPFVRIYSQTEQALYDIANNELVTWQANLTELHRPANSEAESALNDGNIVMKNDNGYRYKFLLRDGYYGEETKIALSNYLLQLGDLVKISSTVQRSLMQKGKYMWRGWFYSNDYHIKTMIDIIAPGAVSNIHTILHNN